MFLKINKKTQTLKEKNTGLCFGRARLVKMDSDFRFVFV